MMDFVFMLTRSDCTVPDCLDVLEELRPLGLRHVGFKDVGVAPEAAAELVARIRDAGATSYLEVVSTSAEDCAQSARLARDIGVDRLLGGTQVEQILAILDGSPVHYLPFPGRPFGHPTQLAGTAAEIAADCRRFQDLGCAGVDLLAYRATEADPLELVRAARAATDGYLLVAGAVSDASRVRALADAGADAFTVGSAAFDGSFSPGSGSLHAQLRAVLDACT
ncbi:MAG: hypothetical protein WKG01_00890 [Kofleriaceae bacterium]